MRALASITTTLLAMCFLYGCESHPNERLLASFDGCHFSQALATLGPPTQTLDDGQGGQVISWTEERLYVPSPPPRVQSSQPCPPGLDPLGYAMGQGMARGMASAAYARGPQRIVSAKIVRVDPNGIVRDWSWREGYMHGSKAEYGAR